MHPKRLEITFQPNESTASVSCPLVEGFVSISGCQSCPHCSGLEIDPLTTKASVLCRKAKPHEHTPKAIIEHRHAPNAFAAATPVHVIMTKDVICVPADALIDTVAQLFLEKGLSGAPVIDRNERPIGMVSKTDLVRVFYQKDHPDAPPIPSSQAWEIMNPIVTILHHDSSIAKAAALMATEGLHRVPVVDRDGKVIGLLSSTDILRWLSIATGEALGE
jgi:CBS domain-containing protein